MRTIIILTEVMDEFDEHRNPWASTKTHNNHYAITVVPLLTTSFLCIIFLSFSLISVLIYRSLRLCCKFCLAVVHHITYSMKGFQTSLVDRGPCLSLFFLDCRLSFCRSRSPFSTFSFFSFSFFFSFFVLLAPQTPNQFVSTPLDP